MATVVINKEDYNYKITTHFNDQNTHLKLTKTSQKIARNKNPNPNHSLLTKLKTKLKDFRGSHVITDKEFNSIRSTTASTLLSYATIKTHK